MISIDRRIIGKQKAYEDVKRQKVLEFNQNMENLK
jgi:hypothetical protein